MMKLLSYSLLLALLVPNLVFAQDDTAEDVASAVTYTDEELQEEKKALTFEKFFMEAIRQKSIENYDKALNALASCKSLFPENIAMLFEIAKNHFKLEHYIEAHHYCKKILDKEPDNFWVLHLSKEIYVKEHDYDGAIEVQEKLYSLKRTEARDLLRLYYYKKDIINGKKLLAVIKKKNINVFNLDFYERYFNNQSKLVEKEDIKKEPLVEINTNDLQKEFATNGSFKVLKELLKREFETENFTDLLKDSNTGLALYPAQAIVYLYNGVALSEQRKHKEAIRILETGLDYNVDNPELSKKFYLALIKSAQAINDTVKANRYKQLVQKL